MNYRILRNLTIILTAVATAGCSVLFPTLQQRINESPIKITTQTHKVKQETTQTSNTVEGITQILEVKKGTTQTTKVLEGVIQTLIGEGIYKYRLLTTTPCDLIIEHYIKQRHEQIKSLGPGFIYDIECTIPTGTKIIKTPNKLEQMITEDYGKKIHEKTQQHQDKLQETPNKNQYKDKLQETPNKNQYKDKSQETPNKNQYQDKSQEKTTYEQNTQETE